MAKPGPQFAIFQALINAFRSEHNANSAWNYKKTILVLLTVLYIISPLDIIPDFIPVLGQADDLGVILFTLLALLAGRKKDSLRDSAPYDVRDDEERDMRDVTPNKKGKK